MACALVQGAKASLNLAGFTRASSKSSLQSIVVIPRPIVLLQHMLVFAAGRLYSSHDKSQMYPCGKHPGIMIQQLSQGVQQVKSNTPMSYLIDCLA